MSLMMISLFAAVTTMTPTLPPLPAHIERQQLRVPVSMRWHPVDARQFDLLIGREEAWRLTLSESCPALPAEGALKVLAKQGHLRVRHAILPDAGKTCVLEHINPLSGADKSVNTPQYDVRRIDISTP